jgi:hypothetical protein
MKLRQLLDDAAAKLAEDPGSPAAGAAIQALLTSVAFPGSKEPLPDLDALTADQRAAVEVLASADGQLAVFPWALPVRGWAIRRWLGRERPGALEVPVTHDVDGEQITEPRWRALRRAGRDLPKVFLAMPISDRLDAYVDIVLGAYRLPRHRLSWGELSEVPAGLGDWAAAAADRVSSIPHGTTPMALRWAIFLSLVRGGRDIEPRWDVLLPAGTGDEHEPMVECVAAVPQTRRDAALLAAVERLAAGAAIVACGLEMLDVYPSDALLGLVWRHSEAAASAPKFARITRRDLDGRLDHLADRHGVLATEIARLRAGEGPVPVLSVQESVCPRGGDALDELRRAQLVEAGRRYDGEAAPVEVRLSEDPDEEDRSFATTVRLTLLVDEAGRPAYDVWEYRGDSGLVYAAGTTDIVAEIVQASLEGGDPALRTALRVALLGGG